MKGLNGLFFYWGLFDLWFCLLEAKHLSMVDEAPWTYVRCAHNRNDGMLGLKDWENRYIVEA
ncbi:MAG: hypothetical protein PVH61_35370 [Candidatus Aminicenantes bacterium]